MEVSVLNSSNILFILHKASLAKYFKIQLNFFLIPLFLYLEEIYA